METVSSFNYLGTFIDNHYNFVENADYEAIKRQCRDNVLSEVENILV